MVTHRVALRLLVLTLLDQPSTDRRVGSGRNYFVDVVSSSAESAIGATDIVQTCWQLLADGLVFIDFAGQSSADNWKWALTERGARAARGDRDYEPDDPEGYLALLESRLSGLDPGVKVYATEALNSYAARCYVASSVMLGVASERAFLLLAEAFLATLTGEEAERFRATLANSRQTFHTKFSEFRKRFEPRRNALPDNLSNNLALTFDGVLDLLRTTRNDGGHPSGRYLNKRDAYINLQLFGRYMERLEGLRQHFLNPEP